MVVKNNYFGWKIRRSRIYCQWWYCWNFRNLRFQGIVRRISQSKKSEWSIILTKKPFETIVLLIPLPWTLSLTYNKSNKLYQEVMQDCEGETKYKKFAIKSNEYSPTMRCKWNSHMPSPVTKPRWIPEHCFIKPYLPEGINVDHVRWLYNRHYACQKINCIWFKDESFEEN
jgi:hypothetical protein